MNTYTNIATVLYAVEIPAGVWAGIELDHQHYLKGVLIVLVCMILVTGGVLTFVKGQAIENRKEMENHEK